MQLNNLRRTLPIILTLVAASTVLAADAIRFDMPSTVAATPSEMNSDWVRCQLRLSSLVESPDMPRIDQWLVQCVPRGQMMQVVDYAPRTEVRSDIDGPIQYKITDEKNRSLGLNLSGGDGKIINGSMGADAGSKKCVSKQYNQIAAVHAVTASGTIDRGRGVYFKLRWTATQVLEGEKTFTLSLRVPPGWRGGLIDVAVTAQSVRKSFGGLDKHVKTVGSANFVVAAYRSGDSEAADLAYAFTTAEQRLRQISRHQNVRTKPTNLPSMLRHVAAKLDLDSLPPKNQWINRLVAGMADPYLDREISRLPIDLRIAAIEYHDSRLEFTRLVDR